MEQTFNSIVFVGNAVCRFYVPAPDVSVVENIPGACDGEGEFVCHSVHARLPCVEISLFL